MFVIIFVHVLVLLLLVAVAFAVAVAAAAAGVVVVVGGRGQPISPDELPLAGRIRRISFFVSSVPYFLALWLIWLWLLWLPGRG